jgi:hypothetical protein
VEELLLIVKLPDNVIPVAPIDDVEEFKMKSDDVSISRFPLDIRKKELPDSMLIGPVADISKSEV